MKLQPRVWYSDIDSALISLIPTYFIRKTITFQNIVVDLIKYDKITEIPSVAIISVLKVTQDQSRLLNNSNAEISKIARVPSIPLECCYCIYKYCTFV